MGRAYLCHMFIREKTTKLSDKTAIQLVESQRQGGKIKQKVVRHFGYATNEDEKQALRGLAHKYKTDLEARTTPTLFETGTLQEKLEKASAKRRANQSMPVDLAHIVEEKRVKTGIHQVYGKLFNQIGFNRVIKNPSRKKATLRLLRDIVMARIHRPESKLSSVGTLADEYGIDAHATSVYRMMDELDETAIEKIKEAAYRNTCGLLGERMDVIFYDCTTLYFESFREDELKANGYSKDGKFNQPQVILALLVSRGGLPIGYELFPGSTFEGHTLANALDRLHEKYQVGRVIFAADSAMLSKENMQLLEERNQPYIVGARIKNMEQSVTQQILDRDNYEPLYRNKQQQKEEEITFRDIELPVKKQDEAYKRLIVSHSPRREAKDARDREKAIEQLRKRLQKSNDPKLLLNNYGYKKYIDIEGESKITLNEDKLKEAAKWDGLHGIITNIPKQEAGALLAHYKGLWQVEETFRLSKHNLRMRPIFHWTPARIKAHIAICYMALTCIRTLEYKVSAQYKKMSPEVIRKCISNLEASVLKDSSTGKRYALPSPATQEAKKIYQVLELDRSETPYLID